MVFKGRKKLRIFLFAGIICAILIVAWEIAGNYFASEMEKKVEESWKKHFFSVETLQTQYPEITTNKSASTLEDLTLKLGIDLTPYQESNSRSLPLKEAELYEQAMSGLFAYLQQQLERNNDAIDLPPQEIRTYLIIHNADIEAIVEHVLNNEAPLWKADFISGQDFYLAYKGVIQLQRVLIASMLEKIRMGQNEEALKLFEASWKINSAFQEQPELVLYIIALSVKKMQQGVLRKFHYVPASFLERFKKYDVEQYYFISTIAETWQIIHLNALPELSFYQKYSVLRLILKPLLNPYVRFCMADNFLNISNALSQIKQGDKCLLNLDEITENYKQSLASWNKMGRAAIPYITIWDRARMLMLSTELTRKVIQVKQIKVLSDNETWPDEVPGIETSMCKDLQWIYKVETEGYMCISLNKKPDWYEPEFPRAFLLPLSYCSR